MRPSDIPAGLRLSEAAGWNQTPADWSYFLDTSPDGCRVAHTDEGEVVATVATLRLGPTLGWIAMVLVDPVHRRAGLGTRMLDEGLEMLIGVPTVRLDATPAGRHVYVPRGFRDEYALQRMVRASDAVGLPENTGRIKLMTDAEFEHVAAMDAAVTGCNRRSLLAMLRREAPAYARVAWEPSGAISGYMFGRRGRIYDHAGPIVAPSETAARALLQSCFSMDRGRPLSVDAPLRPSWVGWLASAHFAVERPLTRMSRGAPFTGEHIEGIFAIAGPEFG